MFPMTDPDTFVFGTSGADLLAGTAGSDLIQAGAGDDIADAGAGDDLIDGGDGNDSLSGGTGADVLLGGAGDDMMDGGCGNDLLIGDGGDDVMIGGAGSDVFGFADFGPWGPAATGSATVTEFDAGEDLIAIQLLWDSTASEQLATFVAGAVQDGDDVVWTSSDGAYAARFAGLDLSDLTVANFLDVEGVLALAA